MFSGFNRLLLLLLLLGTVVGNGQEKKHLPFWQPADSLNTKRLRTVIIGETIATTGAFVGLYHLWYKDYPKSDFHLLNDNAQWLQMDKVGHVYSGYHLSRVGANLLNWTGANQKQQLMYGAGLGFVLMASVEVFDGFSKQIPVLV